LLVSNQFAPQLMHGSRGPSKRCSFDHGDRPAVDSDPSTRNNRESSGGFAFVTRPSTACQVHRTEVWATWTNAVEKALLSRNRHHTSCRFYARYRAAYPPNSGGYPQNGMASGRVRAYPPPLVTSSTPLNPYKYCTGSPPTPHLLDALFLIFYHHIFIFNDKVMKAFPLLTFSANWRLGPRSHAMPRYYVLATTHHRRMGGVELQAVVSGAAGSGL
jgi:hypothetical protein